MRNGGGERGEEGDLGQDGLGQNDREEEKVN